MAEIDIAGLSLLAFCFVLAAGFLAGFIDSIAGGGGLISLPAMLLVGVPPHFCLGTGKFMAFFGTAAATITYMRNKVIVWRVVFVGITFSLVGSAVGAKLVLYVDPNTLGKIMIFLLPFAALLVLCPFRPGAPALEASSKKLWAIAPPLCFIIGAYDGFYGPGAGSFFLLGLHFFLGLPLIAASATAKPFNLASNVGAATVFVVNGAVLYALAVPLVVANVLGNIIGSRLALKLGAKMVRAMLIVSLILLFVTLIQRYYM